ncbi:MAG: sulfatase [Thermoguttaceae bacterium]|jgi:arylsulfatase A-like enzyme|nr:sulfatase [Thermoguttaceae bacterium]MDI9444303.1 sulfatase [Planctomycetota bacterium]
MGHGRMFLGLGLAAVILFARGLPAAQRPNVLFILTDDQRWDCVSLNPQSVIATPATDRLGREGVYFPNHFCTTSLCSPSRASILSGLYAHAHGVSDNFTEYPREMPTWPRALQQAGYETAYVGKYHMGEDNDDVRGGFDYFVTHRGQGKYFDTEFRFNGGARRIVKGYYTTVVTRIAKQWIAGRGGQRPWALILGHKAPHSFYEPEPKYAHAFDHVNIPYPASAFRLDDNDAWYKDRLDTWHGIYGPLFDYRKNWPDRSPAGVEDFAAMVRGYWGTILSVDDSVADLYRLLAENGQLDNTLIIFTSDNGLLSGEHGMIDKRTAHEPSIRIPLVVRYPGLTPPGKPRIVSQMTLTVDLAASILDICGAAPLERTHGRSWKRLAMGRADPGWRTSFLYHYNYEKQFPYTPNVRAVRTEEWKYIRYPHGDGGPDRRKADLFHLAADPDEATNLDGDPRYAGKVAELDAELNRLIAETGAAADAMPIDQGVKQELPDAKIR